MTINIPNSNDVLYTYGGGDIDILERAAENTKLGDELVCSIGVNKGGFVKIIADSLVSTNNVGKIICIDPYGNLEYTLTRDGAKLAVAYAGLIWDPNWGPNYGEDTVQVQYNFSNEMRDSVIPVLHNYCATSGFDFKFFNMTDDQFYQSYANGVPYFINNTEQLYSSYKFVFVDGHPNVSDVLQTVEFFKDRLVSDGIIVFDDCVAYNFAVVNDFLINNGFTLLEKGEWKASYKKT